MSMTTLTPENLHFTSPAVKTSHSVADLFPEIVHFSNHFDSMEEAFVAARLGLSEVEAEAIGALLVK